MNKDTILEAMNNESYGHLLEENELYTLLLQGMNDIKTGNTRPFSEALADIRAGREYETAKDAE